MQRTLALLIVSMAFVAVSKAGDVSVKVTLAKEFGGEATSRFSPDTETIYALFKTSGSKSGDKIRAELIAEDVGEVAPANTKVLDKTLDMDGDTDDGEFDFSKPANGWPIGKYRVDIYVNDKLAAEAKFNVSGQGDKTPRKRLTGKWRISCAAQNFFCTPTSNR